MIIFLKHDFLIILATLVSGPRQSKVSAVKSPVNFFIAIFGEEVFGKGRLFNKVRLFARLRSISGKFIGGGQIILLY